MLQATQILNLCIPKGIVDAMALFYIFIQRNWKIPEVRAVKLLSMISMMAYSHTVLDTESKW